MKRKHSSASSQKGCQIISKFFKTSESQDIHDAARLKEAADSTVSQPKSLVAPVLHKLTKLRETLIKKTTFRSTKTDDDRHENNMNNNSALDKQSESGNSSNCKSSVDEGGVLPQSIKQDSVESAGVVAGNVTSPRNTSLSDFSSHKNGALGTSEQYDSLNSEVFVNDQNHSTNKQFMEHNTVKNNDIEYQEGNNIEHSIEAPLMDELMVTDSDGSLLDRNTEENLADDEEDSEMISEDDESPIKQQLFQVSSRLSNIAHSTETLLDPVAPKHDPEDIVPQKTFSQHDNDLAPACSSQIGDKNFDDSDSDSDDDLLTPPSFLYENKLKVQQLLCTPEKLTTPQGASPLCSPIKPARDMKKEVEDKKYKFSLQKMLNKSKKTEAKDAKLSEMQADLEAGIKKGGVKTMTSTISEDETDTDVDDGKDLSKCNLPEEVSKHLVKVTNFSEKLIGEDIFPEFHNSIFDQELPFLNFPDPVHNDKFLENLISSKPSAVKEVICGQWFLQYYLKRPCPAPLAEWIFNIMCVYPDVYLSTHCFKALWALLRAGYQVQNGIPKGIRGISNWIPTTSSIIYVLQFYGATLETLNFNKQLSSPQKTDTTVKKETKTSKLSTCQPSQLCFYIRQLVQIVTHAVHYGSYMENDLPILLGIMCRLSLDLRLQELLFDLGICISEILNCFGSAQWEEQIETLPSVLALISTNHRNLLHVIQILPPSPRGSRLRQLTCIVLLKFFIEELLNSGNETKNAISRTEQLQNLCKNVTFELSQLSALVEQIKPKKIPNCDNYLLHTIIFLVDLAVGSEDYPSSDRPKLKTLASKLSSLNGEIKDPRAKFLDRTKVKDLIVRTVHRITCLVGTIKPSKEKQLTEYFEVNNSSYTIESLKDSELPSCEEDNSSSNSSSRGPSPTPLADDLSDKDDETI
ncbi:SMC5-SMC6 complex localization factor protein 2 [Exaiptasia diaphana]|uniref:Coiled-coil SMC6 And NSE5 INteracting (CANIN) domain-containing protein n=1 Tax=Exaiptasia diaphana TaxID=2652724 RepID=A0A913Y217_EXADI|nr:SMC5-SMC6 complex localization factor protein 2 [Exaiptasia diaphana]KXJ22923.1 Protein FAM178A [Exaiptasia diaphana]